MLQSTATGIIPGMLIGVAAMRCRLSYLRRYCMPGYSFRALALHYQGPKAETLRCLWRLGRITSGSQANSLPHDKLATKFSLWLVESVCATNWLTSLPSSMRATDHHTFSRSGPTSLVLRRAG